MGYVYLLSNGDYYKIGITRRSIDERIKDLQTGSSNEITLLESYRSTNYRKIETWFHRKHKNKRLKGEWFALEPEDVDNFITEATKIDSNINALKDNPFF